MLEADFTNLFHEAALLLQENLRAGHRKMMRAQWPQVATHGGMLLRCGSHLHAHTQTCACVSLPMESGPSALPCALWVDEPG